MIALLSVLSLLALWLLLAAIESYPWPPQRDTIYWQAVQRDTAAYLATHRNVSPTIRNTVAAMGHAATQKLGGMTR